ncbi:Protein of unknown function (DUF1645 [Striga hermonthica]|uniref:Uncharacterized protein n=1 Tax=Striga hermonthica TaxID=68872 RepID=A0A9N7RJB0_STRHE|nr:Protein of unknown function (DUF1645 [Striga hermonthica]
MQGSVEQRLNGTGQEFELEAQISRDLYTHLNVTGHLQEDGAGFQDSEDEEEEEEEFSFDCGEPSTSPIAAEDAFADGKIKPVYPLFGRDSPFSGEGPAGLPLNPPVRKIFVEADGGGGVGPSGAGSDEIVGPVCEWSSRKAVEASPAAAGQVCKKSNSTGFSKIWRFKELVGIRSNSDGRDAFVFLNGGGGAPAEERAEPTPAGVKTRKEGKKGGKGAKKTASSEAAHEVYLRSKAKEEERRRSYLPYRPELVGFFTNVNGGLTKNVHPF